MHLNKLILGEKSGTEVILKNSLNVVGNSNNENNFNHQLLLTNIKILRLRKVFADNSSAIIKLPKTHLHKIEQ